jgi:hypothetical protein
VNIDDLVASLPPPPADRELPAHWQIRQELLARIETRQGTRLLLRRFSPLAAAVAVASLVLVAVALQPAPARPAASGRTTRPAGPAAHGHGARGLRPGTRSFRVTAPVSTLVINDARGNVTVSAGAGRSIQVTEQVSHYTGTAPQVTHGITDGTLTLAYRSSNCAGNHSGSCAMVNFTVEVPRSTGVSVSDGAGQTSINDLSGPVRVTDEAGDIRLSALSGSVTAQADSGDVTATAVSSPSLTVTALAGDVTATAMTTPDLSVTAQAGDISAAFSTVPRQVQLTATAGDIRLRLPPGDASYRIMASAVAGDTTIGVPRSSTSADLITATATAGDISIIK